MSEIQVLDGEIFIDQRGKISSVNKLRFEEVQRMYLIHHIDTNVIRGWHGHQHEQKWFYCIQGQFTLALVKIDNWETPSVSLQPEIYSLEEQNSRIIHVPQGYANCFKAAAPNSIMLVLSDKILEEALSDSWRYSANLWVDWNKY